MNYLASRTDNVCAAIFHPILTDKALEAIVIDKYLSITLAFPFFFFPGTGMTSLK